MYNIVGEVGGRHATDAELALDAIAAGQCTPQIVDDRGHAQVPRCKGLQARALRTAVGPKRLARVEKAAREARRNRETILRPRDLRRYRRQEPQTTRRRLVLRPPRA